MITTLSQHDAVESLGSKVCPMCGRGKQRKMTFCGGCYHSLPGGMKKALYQRSGQGYEQAVVVAMNYRGCSTFITEGGQP